MNRDGSNQSELQFLYVVSIFKQILTRENKEAAGCESRHSFLSCALERINLENKIVLAIIRRFCLACL